MNTWVRRCRWMVWLGLGGGLVACVAPMHHRVVSEAVVEPPVPTQVYFYPLKDQSAKQQDKDRYQCYLWAKQQTGFDPSSPQLAPHQRLQVVPDPEAGSNAAAGAVTGAIIGSMVGGNDGVEGAIAGAFTGAIIGASSDAARRQQAQRMQTHYDRQSAEQRAQIEQQAANYRRAMMACLEGRGYSVR